MTRRMLGSLARLASLALAAFLSAAPASGQCSDVVFFEDFEDGLPGWSLTGDWVVGPASNCISSCVQGQAAGLELVFGPGCKCDNLGTSGTVDCQGELTSPWIDLPALQPGEGLVLYFCADLFKLFNCFYNPIGDCHRMTLRTASGGGKLFLLLDGSDLSPSCPGPIVAPPFDLTAFGGQTIQLIWEGGCVDSDGGRSVFTVDDVLITHTRPPPAQFCTSLPNSSGTGAEILPSGSTSIAQNDFGLIATACPPGQVGLFFFGSSQVQVPLGNGFLCVSGGIERLVPSSVIQANGSASKPIDNTLPPALGKLVPGSSWNFQFWFRDPAAGGAGFNLTNGLLAHFCQ